MRARGFSVVTIVRPNHSTFQEAQASLQRRRSVSMSSFFVGGDNGVNHQPQHTAHQRQRKHYIWSPLAPTQYRMNMCAQAICESMPVPLREYVSEWCVCV